MSTCLTTVHHSMSSSSNKSKQLANPKPQKTYICQDGSTLITGKLAGHTNAVANHTRKAVNTVIGLGDPKVIRFYGDELKRAAASADEHLQRQAERIENGEKPNYLINPGKSKTPKPPTSTITFANVK